MNILVENSDGQFIVFAQEKYGLLNASLAVVGGLIETGEAPLAGKEA